MEVGRGWGFSRVFFFWVRVCFDCDLVFGVRFLFAIGFDFFCFVFFGLR